MDVKAFAEKYKKAGIIVAAVAAFGLYQLGAKEPEQIQEPLLIQGDNAGSEPKQSGDAAKESEKPKEPSILMIDIKGAVAMPGIYALKEGQRINDAIGKAGGFQPEADAAKVNLAQKLADEMVIYIPKAGEELPAELPQVLPSGPSSAGSSPAEGSEPEGGTININTATATQLQELPGIGEAKAQAIIDYRESSGLFSKVEDVKNVSGIGEKTFEKLAPKLAVD